MEFINNLHSEKIFAFNKMYLCTKRAWVKLPTCLTFKTYLSLLTASLWYWREKREMTYMCVLIYCTVFTFSVFILFLDFCILRIWTILFNYSFFSFFFIMPCYWTIMLIVIAYLTSNLFFPLQIFRFHYQWLSNVQIQKTHLTQNDIYIKGYVLAILKNQASARADKKHKQW